VVVTNRRFSVPQALCRCSSRPAHRQGSRSLFLLRLGDTSPEVVRALLMNITVRAFAHAVGSGDLRLEVDARNMLGAVHAHVDAGTARQHYLSARQVAASIGFAYGEAEALISMAQLGMRTGGMSSTYSRELAEARRIVERHHLGALEHQMRAHKL
jgi:hypothetical protein